MEEENNKTIDYSKYFDKEKPAEGSAPAESSVPVKAGFLRTFWAQADKKVKIEMIVFATIILATIGLFVFYLFI
jgi:hypothetical protein